MQAGQQARQSDYPWLSSRLAVGAAMKRTPEQILLAVHLKELGIKTMPEYQFCARKWRFDLVALDQRLAFEIEGGIWTRGRHSRGAGMLADMEKYNVATLLGWRVLRFAPEQVKTGKAKAFLAEWLANEARRTSHSRA